MQLSELPTRRDEAWKYSDLRAALADAALPAERQRPAAAWGKLDGVIERLALAQGRHAITKVRAGAEEVLIERIGAGAGLEAGVREIQVSPGAQLTRILIQAGGDVVLQVAHVAVSAGAAYRQFILADGARLARIETHVTVEGERAEVELDAIYLCADGRHADLTSVVEHKAIGGQTRQLIKGAVRKGGSGVFQGRIVVAKGAQKTDARQHHRGLLLEAGGEIFAKPELTIFADDVVCAHGNAIGGLDGEAIFYLQSRGVPEPEARAILTEAFLLEALPGWAPELVRGEIEAQVCFWLRGAVR